MFTGKMLICDMDGTLLDSNHLISGENKAALKRFTDNGGLFTVATGRMHYSLEPYLKDLPVNVPAILYNGAMIYDFAERKILWENNLPDIAFDTVREAAAEFPETGIEIYHSDKIYFIQENEYTESHVKMEQTTIEHVSLENVPFPWIKVIFADTNANLLEIQKWLNSKNLPFRSTFSFITFLELLENHASKGHAMIELARITGVPVKNIYAMGDNLNDLEMIQMAGTGIAVSNAHPELKKAAAVRMPHHDENAVAHVIEWIERLP